MNNISFFTALLCISLFSIPSYAQKTPKQWGNLFKKTSAELKGSSTSAGSCLKPLSLEESVALENRLLALSELSRTLRRNPNLPNESHFAQYAQTLTLIGETLPPAPPPNASAAEKQRYATQVHQYLNRRLQEEEAHLTLHMRPQDGFVSSLTANKINWLKRRHERTLANAQQTKKWEFIQEASQNRKDTFSWGEKDWDEVTIGPAQMPQDEKDPLFSARETLHKLAANPPQNFIAAMDFITYSPLTPYQKQKMWLHFAHINDVIGYQLAYGYMGVFHKIPALKAPGILKQEESPSLTQYARDTQLVLIEKLKKGEKWSEQQANAFFDLGVFLKQDNRKDILAALTYLEPNAAFYLLAHPMENAITHQLRAEIKAAREKATVSAGIIQKAPLQTKTGVFSSQRRLFALSSYYETLQNRLSHIEKRFITRKYQLQQIKRQPLPQDPTSRMDKLSYQLYCQLDLQHLQELKDKLDARSKQIQTEILGLYKTSGFK